ncbi:MAG: sigma 54-interacting transcriptional regulator [Thermodesulfobacteriota bacterium]
MQKELIKDYFCDNWKDVVDKMKEGLMIVNPEGKILYVNRALQEMLLFGEDDLLGQPCNILECDTCFGHDRSRDGKHCNLFLKGDVSDLSCSFKQKNGNRLKVLKNATVLKDRDNRIVAGVETLTDLSAVVSKEKVISDLRRQLNQENGFYGLIGNSPGMKQVYDLISSAAQSSAPIIIYGESGTGKELIANAIHRLSKRSDGPFIKVNCAALNENILESELFGHTKGSFTGADRARTGRFEAADNGSIFLDEVGDLPLATQTKLLRVLQEQEIERVGDHKPIPIDVRVISATNKKLSKLMGEEKFREDLYYRIGVLPINIPPLRSRLEDIPLLVKTFIDRSRLKTEKNISSIRRDAMDLLLNYHWPGNIRELNNVIEYCFVICPEGEITPDHLPQQFHGTEEQQSKTISLSPHPAADRRERLLNVLNRTRGNKSEAARLLGISRVTLWKHLKKYNIKVDKSAY